MFAVINIVYDKIKNIDHIHYMNKNNNKKYKSQNDVFPCYDLYEK